MQTQKENNNEVLFLISQTVQDHHNNYALQQLQYKKIYIKMEFNTDKVVTQDCHKINIIIKLHSPK